MPVNARQGFGPHYAVQRVNVPSMPASMPVNARQRPSMPSRFNAPHYAVHRVNARVNARVNDRHCPSMPVNARQRPRQ